MITREEDEDIHALHRQGWTITAITNHVGSDLKTVGKLPERQPGTRLRKRAEDPVRAMATVGAPAP